MTSRSAPWNSGWATDLEVVLLLYSRIDPTGNHAIDQPGLADSLKRDDSDGAVRVGRIGKHLMERFHELLGLDFVADVLIAAFDISASHPDHPKGQGAAPAPN